MNILDNNIENISWKIKKITLTNASEYISEIDNISWATTGLVDAMIANRFFDEACQMIVNSIYLFQEGFFDAAFYSLRQSIEISIGTLFLISNPEKITKWEKLESGFESGKMVDFLQKHESVFNDVRTKMSDFFVNVRNVQLKTNKYVHKQGYVAFYTSQRYPYFKDYENIIIKDYESVIKTAIGAVAVYRLAIDPLPIIFMDEDLLYRSGDFLTEPYSERFVEKYIGEDTIKLYKQTDIYQSYKSYFMQNEKQNEAIYNIIHWQIIERSKITDIKAQIHLLSDIDKIAVEVIMISPKISYVFIEGIYNYCSETKALHADMILSEEYYDEFFINKQNYNVPFKDGTYISKIIIKSKSLFIESNEPFNENEIVQLTKVAKELEKELIKKEEDINAS